MAQKRSSRVEVELRTPRESIREGHFSKTGKDAALGAISILPPQRLAQNRLILRILKECVSKFKLSMILPNVFENPLTVAQILKGTEYEDCAAALLEYLRGRSKSTNLKDGTSLSFDYQLIKVINLFHTKHNVLDILPAWLNPSSVSDQSIVEAFDLLTHIVDQRMHRVAIDEIEKEKEMHKFHRENVILRKEIDILRRKLRIQKQQQRWKRALRSGEASKTQDELLANRWNHMEKVSQMMVDNAKRIKSLNHAHGIKSNQLDEDCQAAEAVFRKRKFTNYKELKSVREEKNKLLIQLQNTIEKHDRVLGEKIKENVYLQDEFDKQREEMDHFMIGYSELEREYNEIIAIETAERERVWKERAEFFFRTRAVRIIQRYLRMWLDERKREAKAAKAAKAAKGAKGAKAAGKEAGKKGDKKK